MIELVVRRLIERLPVRAFRHLAVAEQDPGAIGELVQVLAVQGHADADGQPLAERAGRHVDVRQDVRVGVALQAAAELTQAQQLGVRDRSGRLEHRVEQRAGVALAEDQAVVAGLTGVGPVISQVFGEEHGHEVGGGHAGSRVARPRFRRAADAVHAQLGR